MDETRPLTVTWIVPTLTVAGGVKAIFGYADRLGRRGHRSVLVWAAGSPLRRLIARWRGRGAVDWYPLETPLTPVTHLTPAAVPDGDAVIATGWQTARFVADLPPTKGRKLYFIQHDESLWAGPPDEVDATYRLPLHPVVISDWLRETLRPRLGRDADVLVTPVDDGGMGDDGGRSGTGPVRVGLLHHTFDWKGFDDGRKAFEAARARIPGLTLAVLGGRTPVPPVDAEYRYKPDAAGLRRFYRSCHVFLVPSWHEGLGMHAMEAMACGCALVTTDTGGGRDFAVDGETALVSPPRDVARLSENLVRAASDADLRRRLSEAGARRIRAWTWSDQVTRLERILRGEDGGTTNGQPPTTNKHPMVNGQP